MVREVFSSILLGLAVAVVIASAAGVLMMRDAAQKLHFVTPVAMVAPLLVVLAVLVQHGLQEDTGESFVALLFMVIAGPFVSHATIRAIRVRQTGDWRVRRHGQAPAEEQEQ